MNDSGDVAPCVLVVGTGVMGSRVAAWLLVLGERVRIWTTTGRALPTIPQACEGARAEVCQAIESEVGSGFSISAAVAASMLAGDDLELLAKLPFAAAEPGASLKAKEELWERLSVEANDGRHGRPDNRNASNVWLTIDCTRDPGPTDEEKAVAAQKTAQLFSKVKAQSPKAVLAIKHEVLDWRDVQNACGHPVIRLRFLKPVFFIPFVELQGTDSVAIANVSNWLANFHLMPFTSAFRVRIMQGASVDEQVFRQMRIYAQHHYKGVLPDEDVCCVCLASPAVVLNASCGHRVFCGTCSLDYSAKGVQQCPICRAPWHQELALHLDLDAPLAQQGLPSPELGVPQPGAAAGAARPGTEPVELTEI